jgi:hypothetical protein
VILLVKGKLQLGNSLKIIVNMSTAPAHGVKNVIDIRKSKDMEYDKRPAFSSFVYCQLGPVEHSGIYDGNDRVDLNA